MHNRALVILINVSILSMNNSTAVAEQIQPSGTNAVLHATTRRTFGNSELPFPVSPAQTASRLPRGGPGDLWVLIEVDGVATCADHLAAEVLQLTVPGVA